MSFKFDICVGWTCTFWWVIRYVIKSRILKKSVNACPPIFCVVKSGNRWFIKINQNEFAVRLKSIFWPKVEIFGRKSPLTNATVKLTENSRHVSASKTIKIDENTKGYHDHFDTFCMHNNCQSKNCRMWYP